MNTAVFANNVPDLTPNSLSGSYSDQNFWMDKYLQTTGSDEHEQAFKSWQCSAIVRLTMRHHRESANMKARIEWNKIKQLMKRKSFSVPLSWLLCDVHQWNRLGVLLMSLTQKPVHRHVPYETRVLHASGNITGVPLYLMNDARRPAADGPDRRTCSTNLIDERLCSRTKKKSYIVILCIGDQVWDVAKHCVFW